MFPDFSPPPRPATYLQVSPTGKSSDQDDDEAVGAAELSEEEITAFEEVTTEGEIESEGEVETDGQVETEKEPEFEGGFESNLETVSLEEKASSMDLAYSEVGGWEEAEEEVGPTYPFEQIRREGVPKDRDAPHPSEARDSRDLSTQPSQRAVGSSEQAGPDASGARASRSVRAPGSILSKCLLWFVTLREGLQGIF